MINKWSDASYKVECVAHCTGHIFNVCIQDDRQMHVYALIEMDVPYFYPLDVIG